MSLEDESKLSSEHMNFKAPDNSTPDGSQSETIEDDEDPTERIDNDSPVIVSGDEGSAITGSKEEWDRHVAERKHQDAILVEKINTEQRERDQKWELRIQKLNSIVPTGDIIEDAKVFFQAIDLNLDKLDFQDREAFLSGDEEGMAHYFEGMSVAIAPSGGDAFQRYFETRSKVAGEIKQAYITKKSEREMRKIK